jgi:hypothetical protein
VRLLKAAHTVRKPSNPDCLRQREDIGFQRAETWSLCSLLFIQKGAMSQDSNTPAPDCTQEKPDTFQERRQALSTVSGGKTNKKLKAWVFARCNPRGPGSETYFRLTMNDLCNIHRTPYDIFFHVFALIQQGGWPELVYYAYIRRKINCDLRRQTDVTSRAASTVNLENVQKDTSMTQSLYSSTVGEMDLVAEKMSKFTFNPSVAVWTPDSMQSSDQGTEDRLVGLLDSQ